MMREYSANGTPKQFANLVIILNKNKGAEEIRFVVPEEAYLDLAPDPQARTKVLLLKPPKQILAEIYAIPLPTGRTLITFGPVEGFQKECELPWIELLAQLRKRDWNINEFNGLKPFKKKVRNKLPYEELVYRLAKAREAVELKSSDPNLTWREIVQIIQFDRGGTQKSREKLLSIARFRLEDARKQDEKELLDDVEIIYLKMKGKEKKS